MRIEQECHNGVSMVDMDIGSDVELALEKRPEFPNEDPEPDEPETKDPLEGPVFRNMIASEQLQNHAIYYYIIFMNWISINVVNKYIW